MPDAQIPVMIMTPNNSCLSATEKPNIQKHPYWNPYAFDALELEVNKKSDEANDYGKYRRWLILKEKEFVDKQQKVSDKVRKMTVVRKKREDVEEQKVAEKEKSKHPMEKNKSKDSNSKGPENKNDKKRESAPVIPDAAALEE
jgi:hypothetical protein